MPEIRLRHLGLQPYETSWEAMRRFTDERGAASPDEFWLLEHPPVFTQGLNGKPEHLLAAGKIPLVQSDRGGQVTYHGPGQAVLYALLDLRRRGLGVRHLVEALELAVVDLLADFDIAAHPRRDAPGVYVASGAKVASLGLRVRRGCSYHGVALNVDLDLAPFARINPCGQPGLAVTRLADLGVGLSTGEAGVRLARRLAARLGDELADN